MFLYKDIPFQKAVLRRRKANIGDAVEDCAGLVKGMKDNGLIDDDFIAKNIKVRKGSNRQQLLCLYIISLKQKIYNIKTS